MKRIAKAAMLLAASLTTTPALAGAASQTWYGATRDWTVWSDKSPHGCSIFPTSGVGVMLANFSYNAKHNYSILVVSQPTAGQTWRPEGDMTLTILLSNISAQTGRPGVMQNFGEHTFEHNFITVEKMPAEQYAVIVKDGKGFLNAVKHADFLAAGAKGDVMFRGGLGDIHKAIPMMIECAERVRG